MKYRKKPVVIEAFRWGVDFLPDWFASALLAKQVVLYDKVVGIHTLEGWMCAYIGDYIIRGVKGEIYPCKPDVFSMTYEEITDDA